jgi:hypothetical protein
MMNINAKRLARGAQLAAALSAIVSAIGFGLGSKPTGSAFAILALVLVVPAGLVLYRSASRS